MFVTVDVDDDANQTDTKAVVRPGPLLDSNLYNNRWGRIHLVLPPVCWPEPDPQ